LRLTTWLAGYPNVPIPGSVTVPAPLLLMLMVLQLVTKLAVMELLTLMVIVALAEFTLGRMGLVLPVQLTNV
jgi:hypothetical protein